MNKKNDTISKDEAMRLTELFYKAEITDEEEQRLLRYFNSGDIAPELEADGEMIRGLAGSLDVPAGLQARLEHSINEWNTVERKASQRMRRTGIRYITAAAACIILIMSAILTLYSRTDSNDTAVAGKQEQPMQDTFSNPEDAYAETRRALTLFSECLNDGLETARLSTDNTKNEEQ